MIGKLKKEKDVNSTAKCRHCGGQLRDYRNGISCLMCGRAQGHNCERCRYAEDEVLRKKVA